MLDGIPGVLIHGRYVRSPLDTAWRIHQGWQTSELHVIGDMGHGGGDSLLDTVPTAFEQSCRLGARTAEACHRAGESGSSR
jgi:hypothetical protein